MNLDVWVIETKWLSINAYFSAVLAEALSVFSVLKFTYLSCLLLKTILC